MLYPVPFLGPFGVVEAIQRAYQIAGYAVDALKLDALADLAAYDFSFITVIPHVVFSNLPGGAYPLPFATQRTFFHPSPTARRPLQMPVRTQNRQI